jgi:hypothetical protein
MMAISVHHVSPSLGNLLAVLAIATLNDPDLARHQNPQFYRCVMSHENLRYPHNDFLRGRHASSESTEE